MNVVADRPDDPLYLVENGLRDLIAEVLKRKYGESWEDHLGCSADRAALWRERREVEEHRRTGAVIEQRLLYYSDFYDLGTLVDKHWNDGLSECFGDKRATELYLKRLDGLRNPGAHSRELMQFERNLVSGMADELRQKITLHHSTAGAGEPKEYFARIESITDNFGRSTTGSASGGRGIEATVMLRVGDQIHFRCSAWDPDDGDWNGSCRRVPSKPFARVGRLTSTWT